MHRLLWTENYLVRNLPRRSALSSSLKLNISLIRRLRQDVQVHLPLNGHPLNGHPLTGLPISLIHRIPDLRHRLKQTGRRRLLTVPLQGPGRPMKADLYHRPHETTRIDLSIHRLQGRISRARVRQTISRARIILLRKAEIVVRRIRLLPTEVSLVAAIPGDPTSRADHQVLRAVEVDPQEEEAADLLAEVEVSHRHLHHAEEDNHTKDIFYITTACRPVDHWSAS